MIPMSKFVEGVVYTRPSRQKKHLEIQYLAIKRNNSTNYVTFVRLKDGRMVGPKIARKVSKAAWADYEYCYLDKKNNITLSSNRREMI